MCSCLVAQLCLNLCDPMDYSPPGSSVHRILQARILEGVAVSSSRGSFQPKDQTLVSFSSCTANRFSTAGPSGKVQCSHSVVCDSLQPHDYSPPGSSVHRILQVRILELAAVPISRGSFQPRDWTRLSCAAGGFLIVCVTREAIGDVSPKSSLINKYR